MTKGEVQVTQFLCTECI